MSKGEAKQEGPQQFLESPSSAFLRVLLVLG